jgi:hypothetical protein
MGRQQDERASQRYGASIERLGRLVSRNFHADFPALCLSLMVKIMGVSFRAVGREAEVRFIIGDICTISHQNISKRDEKLFSIIMREKDVELSSLEG